MSQRKIKSSLYLNQGLHKRAKALSKATSFSLNTLVALALEEYLADEGRAAAIEQELASEEHA